MKVTVFAGDIANAAAEAICTSTNPRLSLMMGTGASVRAAGGYEILRECEAIVANSGRPALAAGSAHVTTAGALAAKCVIHCVASDTSHRSSDEIIALCVRNALQAADALGCRSIAMPVFASGHARIKFDRAIAAMASAVRGAGTDIEHLIISVRERELAESAVRAFPGASMEMSSVADDEPVSLWSFDSDRRF